MDADEFLRKHGPTMDARTPWERRYVSEVMARVPGLNFTFVQAQAPFNDTRGKPRRIDFAIREPPHVKIAIEVDGYDKTGRGTGMNRDEFRDWSLKEQSLAAQGWRVLRVANSLIERDPDSCALCLELLLKLERGQETSSGTRSPAVETGALERELAGVQKRLDRIERQELPERSSGRRKTHFYAIATASVALLAIAAAVIYLAVSNSGESGPSAAVAGCQSPNWDESSIRPGRVRRVVGPVVSATFLRRVSGSPTFLDIGAPYPDRRRVVLVIWGRNRDRFDEPPETRYAGMTVSAIGRVESFRGVRQVEVRGPSGIRVCS